MSRHVVMRQESWPLKGVFGIARGARSSIEPLLVEIHEDGVCGRGEANFSTGSRYGESLEQIKATIANIVPRLEAGLDRTEIAEYMPPGLARNAIDCALWELQAKRQQVPVWKLAGLSAPEPVITAYTLSVDSPEQMALAAHEHAARPLLKIKLNGDGADLARVEAVRRNAPAARLIIDANECWSKTDYETLIPAFSQLNVDLIEQPFNAADDALLASLPRPIPVAADESCCTSADLPRLLGRYDVVNIKLDKTGGLSEALILREAALAQGLQIMVGCMLGTSLAMAPALLVAQGAGWVDLDGPLWLAQDRQPGLRFNGSCIEPLTPEVWG